MEENMRKIIQQMLKGEQVAFCESVQTELKALAAEKEKALVPCFFQETKTL